MTEQHIYIIETGHMYDARPRLVLEGPADLDIAAFHAALEAQADQVVAARFHISDPEDVAHYRFDEDYLDAVQHVAAQFGLTLRASSLLNVATHESPGYEHRELRYVSQPLV